MATTAYCATNMLAKVYIDRYLGHPHDLKMTPNRLSFEQYLFIATDQYLLVTAIGVRWYRSIPIAQRNRFCKGFDRCLLPNPMGSRGYRSISADKIIDLQGFRSIPTVVTACKFKPYCLEQHTNTVYLGYCLNGCLG